MKDYIIKYIRIFPIPLISVLLMSLLFSISNLLGVKTNNLIILIVMIIVMFTSGYLLSNTIAKKKYLHGLFFGVLLSILFFIISLFFKVSYSFNVLIYYIVLSLSSMIGSMFSSIKK